MSVKMSFEDADRKIETYTMRPSRPSTLMLPSQ